jgi:hypothetical protein
MALEGSSLNLATAVIQMMKWNAPHILLHKENEKHDLQLGVAPLGELLENFHLHEASDRRDKIFPLIGACRDSNEVGNLPIPDYTKRFSVVLREVIAYLVGPSMHAITWDHRELSIITGRGCPLGRVSSRLLELDTSVEFAHFSDIRLHCSRVYMPHIARQHMCLKQQGHFVELSRWSHLMAVIGMSANITDITRCVCLPCRWQRSRCAGHA